MSYMYATYKPQLTTAKRIVYRAFTHDPDADFTMHHELSVLSIVLAL